MHSFDFLDGTIEGYIYSLSPIKRAVNNSTTYFDCVIQTASNESFRAVCYTPKMRLDLQQASTNKSPVKIIGVKAKENKRLQSPLKLHYPP